MSPSGSTPSQPSQVMTTTIPSRDPRMRDPRKKALSQNASSGSSSVLSLPMPPTATNPAPVVEEPRPSYSAPMASTSAKNIDEETFESMVERQIQMANQMAQQQGSGDIDHRQVYAPSPTSMQPNLYAPITPRVPGSNGSPKSDFGYSSNNSYRPPRPPRYNNPNDPRTANYYNNPNEGNYSPNNWDNNGYTSPPSGATSPPNQLFGEITTSSTASTTTATTSTAPLSLREKRKNNEYESPLGRARTAY